MRYALTYQSDDWWGSVDTVIVDDGMARSEGGYCWYEDKEKIKEVLMSYGLKDMEADYVVNMKQYFVRNIDDTDITLGINGEIL